ncbi:MAG: ABC transporter permease [Bacilli bacterium]
MKNKLLFLTKMSLNKKIKTKWFLIANIIFAVLIIGLINIDTIIKAFGGDFNETQEILIIDEVGAFSKFESNYEVYKKYVADYDDVKITKYEGSYDEGVELVEEDDKILLVISPDEDNYIKAKLVSNDTLGTITNTLISTTLTAIRSEIVLNEYNITEEMYQKINANVEVEDVILSSENTEDNMIISTVMQIITLPIFMLIIFLVQMIGAEVNEEKTTKSMEIIISNVSPKTHFMSKVISSNLFVIIQGLLLVIFVVIGIVIRYFVSGGNLIGELDGEVTKLVSSISLSGVMDTLTYMIPIMIVILLLTFLAYSLLAGVLASMTTNLEDFQQLQTPIVIVLLAGYYLSMMAGVFKGSVFIRIMSYIPFVSSLLAPTLYVMGEITWIDLVGSVALLLLVIFLLIKYGLRIYKVGILNYSQSGLWKKMFKAIKEK